MSTFLGLLCMATVALGVVAVVVLVVSAVVNRGTRSTRPTNLPRRKQPDMPAAALAGSSLAPTAYAAAQPAPRGQRSSPPTALDCWLPPRTDVVIHGRSIRGGLIYVGSGLPSGAPSYGSSIEPALLDPRLPCGAPGSGHMADLPYWPQYATLTPPHRAALLDWLASGRADPNVDLGTVFVYFYGLERRLLIDGIRDRIPAVWQEAPYIITEIKRLQGIYGDSGSFRMYSRQLLLWAQVLFAGTVEFTTDLDLTFQESDPAVTVALGQLAATSAPLPWHVALRWYLASEDRRLRTPATRCWSLFLKLFELRYRAKFGEGLVVKENKSRLRMHYTPASPGLSGLREGLQLPVDLPDVTKLTRPVRQVAEVVEACQSALEPYSRWIGRNPNGEGTIEASVLLPPELAAEVKNPDVDALRAELEQRVAGQDIVVCASDFLFTYWTTAKPEAMSKTEMVALAQALERLGYGVEPDARFGGRPAARGANVALFRQHAGDAMRSPSAAYASATVVLHVAALVATADGVVDRSEEAALERYLENSMDLSAAERRRLLAHLRWLTASGPQFQGLKKRVETLEPDARRALADFAVVMASADGHIDPEEIKVLRRIYSMLKLDAEEVFQDVHASTTGPDRGPVQVRPAAAKSKGARIPPPPTEQPQAAAPDGPRLSVDMDRVRQKLKDTAKVSAMLGDIFVEEEAEEERSHAVPTGSEQPTAAQGVLGTKQLSFLQRVAEQSHWPQVDLEALASELGVMLEGTIEAINELAFDKLDQAVIEWGDPVEVDVAAAQELCT